MGTGYRFQINPAGFPEFISGLSIMADDQIGDPVQDISACLTGGGSFIDQVETPNRYPYIDVLRGLAILLVLCHHVIFLPGYRHDPTSLQYITYLVGWAGVDLFFVISGFLIGRIIFRELRDTGNFRVGRFWVRRALRILPVYYAVLIPVLLLADSAHVDGWTWISHPLFLQNYTGFLPPASGFMFIHSWSLSIEEHFYFVYPLVAFALWKVGRLKLYPVLALALLPICLGLRLAFASGNSDLDIMTLVYQTHFRADSLAAGTLIAYAFIFDPVRLDCIVKKKWTLILICFVAFLPLFSIPIHGGPAMKTWGLTLNLLGCSALLLLALRGDPAARLRFLRPIAYTGTLTYTIYLVHPIVVSPAVLTSIPELEVTLREWGLSITHSSLPLVGFAHILVYLALSLPLAWLLAVIIERPVLRWRKRLTD